MPTFTTTESSKREEKVFSFLGKQWKCEFNHLGLYSPIDYWAVKDGRPVGWFELKSSKFKSKQSSYSLLLNTRKWVTLSTLKFSSPYPAFFVGCAELPDSYQIFWTKIEDISASCNNWKVIDGRKARALPTSASPFTVKSDVEVCISINTSAMVCAGELAK